jgi:hypothetical protein
LTDTPSVLASLVRSTYGTYVLPLPRLGAQYVPDFAIAAADSAGIHWTVVEIESPTATLSTQDGRFAVKLREAIDQINDWRDWLASHLAYARSPVAENGLGLAGIDTSPQALVLIGVAGHRHPKFNTARRRLVQEQRINVHSYSWLVQTLRSHAHPLLAPLDDPRDWM